MQSQGLFRCGAPSWGFEGDDGTWASACGRLFTVESARNILKHVAQVQFVGVRVHVKCIQDLQKNENN